jgi:hypothetical protein
MRFSLVTNGFDSAKYIFVINYEAQLIYTELEWKYLEVHSHLKNPQSE